METLAEIKEQLEVNDRKRIHEMTKVPMTTIYSFFQGVRNINTPTGAKVLKAAKEVIRNRKKLVGLEQNTSGASEPDSLPLFEG